jgi:hypothetical protein
MMRAEDALKYAAAILTKRTGWACEAIGTSEECGTSEMYGDDVHGDELTAISAAVDEIRALAARFGDPRRYSDGRPIGTYAEIVPGFHTEHIWLPNPAEEKPRSWRDELPSFDPDLPSPGRYEVSTDPATQQVHVRVMRTS